MPATGTIAPANSSCGITASGTKLIAWSGVPEKAEIASPMHTATHPVAMNSANTESQAPRSASSGRKASSRPA